VTSPACTNSSCGGSAAAPIAASSPPVTSTWGTVHGSNANYTRMALSLVDNHFGSTPPAASTQPTQPSASAKRPRAESTSSSAYDSGPKAGRPIPALSSFRPTRFKAPAPPASRLYLALQGADARGSKRGFYSGSGGRSGN
jgi:hypothetical protein